MNLDSLIGDSFEWICDFYCFIITSQCNKIQYNWFVQVILQIHKIFISIIIIFRFLQFDNSIDIPGSLRRILLANFHVWPTINCIGHVKYQKVASPMGYLEHVHTFDIRWHRKLRTSHLKNKQPNIQKIKAMAFFYNLTAINVPAVVNWNAVRWS